jgi:hypothetical protein
MRRWLAGLASAFQFMNDWLSTYLGVPDLNGSTAPNSSAIPLSTPVDTSGGNTNTSGTGLLGFLSGLAGIGSTAANAYATVTGRPVPAAPGTTARAAMATTTPATGIAKYLPWILTGLGITALIWLLTRAAKS